MRPRLVIVGSSLLIRDTGSASAKVFKRGGRVPEKHELTKVESKRQHLQAERVLSREVGQEHQDEKTLEGKDLSNAPVFTFEDVRYTVQVGGGDSASRSLRLSRSTVAHLDAVSPQRSSSTVSPPSCNLGGSLRSWALPGAFITFTPLHSLVETVLTRLFPQRGQDDAPRHGLSAKDERQSRRSIPH